MLQKIRRGEVKRIPKYVFSARGALLILAIMLVAAFLLYVTSFLFFAVQVSGLWDLTAFGFIGMELLVGNFPWLIVALAIVFIAVLEVLLAHYTFVYRRPLLYSAICIALLVVLTGLGIRYTKLHELIYGHIEQGSLQGAKPLYERYTNPNPNQFHPGTVLEVRADGFTLEQRDRSVLYVHITPQTRMKEGFKIYPGGRLLVVGHVVDGSIIAEIIDNAPPSGKP